MADIFIVVVVVVVVVADFDAVVVVVAKLNCKVKIFSLLHECTIPNALYDPY